VGRVRDNWLFRGTVVDGIQGSGVDNYSVQVEEWY